MLSFIFLIFLLLGSATNEKEGLFQSVLVMAVKQNGNEFQGFFQVNQTYEIRFIIRNDFMYLRKMRGQDLVLFYQYSPDVHYLKVFDSGILRYKSKEFSLPFDTPQEGLLKCLRKCIRTKLKDIESFSRFLRAKRSFRTPQQRLSWSEVVILANMSEAVAQRMLYASKVQKQLIQRFHLLVQGLVNAVGPPLHTIKPSTRANLYSKAVLSDTDFPAASDYAEAPKTENTTSRYHSNHSLSSCSDMRYTSYQTHCFGMCGSYCWCWPWVCGDCCLHKGCLQHDICCQKRGYLSIYCFSPWVFGFDCENGYLGYPECLYT
ncbi:uncharacterized protein LOC116296724 [Actinia tenebrosa]|uniref:Uncharacterized protein LOC116296724 n=1 Tax=Actinia tenebrosa TaxID=6105 RepID=A0A6P8HW71_ACTTE|nr:uncharacterized protein LOC116296724 [Actinia tenebrosa]